MALLLGIVQLPASYAKLLQRTIGLRLGLSRVSQHHIAQQAAQLAGLKWPKQNDLQGLLNMLYISQYGKTL
jgi:hypothetical protein